MRTRETSMPSTEVPDIMPRTSMGLLVMNRRKKFLTQRTQRTQRRRGAIGEKGNSGYRLEDRPNSCRAQLLEQMFKEFLERFPMRGDKTHSAYYASDVLERQFRNRKIALFFGLRGLFDQNLK